MRLNVHSWLARWLYFGSAAVLCVATLGGIADPAVGGDRSIPVGVALLVLEGVLMVRSLRLGLVFHPGLLTVRGLFMTRRFDARSVSSVEPVGYSGLMNWGATSKRLGMVRIQVAGREVDLVQLIDSPSGVRSNAARLNEALAIES